MANSFSDFLRRHPPRLEDDRRARKAAGIVFDVVRIPQLDRRLMADRAGEAVGVPRPKHISYGDPDAYLSTCEGQNKVS